MTYPRHLLQSPGWAEFRTKWGTKVVAVGNAQFTIHPLPFKPWTVGYMPRVYPADINWKLLAEKAKEENCIFVKIEPNSESFTPPQEYDVRQGERIFAYATFLIDLKKSDEELLKAMHTKTRYNIGLARRKGVTVKIGHTEEMVNEFLSLYHETSERHDMVNHPDSYYKQMFSTFSSHENAEIVTAYFEGNPLASMVIVFYNDTMFYPYGGSTHLHKDKMAFHLVFWEAMQLGKKRGCNYFDLWNCLTPEQESENHPWYGFHRFKKGFGGEFVQFPGAYDVVFQPMLYPPVLILNKIRWAALKTGMVLKKVMRR